MNKQFKLTFWKRIFWSSKRIQEQIELNQKEIINNLNNEIILLKKDFDNLENNFNKQLETNNLLNNEKEELYKEKIIYKNDLDQRNNDLNNCKDKYAELKEKLGRDIETINNLSREKEKILAENEQITKLLDQEKHKNNDLIALEKSLNENLNIKNENLNILRHEISNKLDPLKTIKETFFAHNKGRGIFGEMKLKNSLERSGIDKDIWVENLMVGNDQVEFAFKSDIDNKYIPIDSKVIQYREDENNEIIITDEYEKNIKTNVKRITKYLNKKNTTDYGIMVLQSDELYLKLFNERPELFHESINKHKIYIFGTSSFIQFAIFMKYIIDISKRVKEMNNNFILIDEYIKSTNKFYKASSEGFDKLHTAFKTHWNTIEKRGNVVNKLINAPPILKEKQSADLQKKINN